MLQKLTLTENSAQLSEITNKLRRSKKIIIVTGAGISTSAGIPDFRSKDGLYDLIRQKYPQLKLKGHELFDRLAITQSPLHIEAFCTFMGELKKTVSKARPTRAHKFFRKLADKKQLIRCYTQNVDGLENAVGLDVIKVHGDMGQLICQFCKGIVLFDKKYVRIFENGQMPECPSCSRDENERREQGKRPHKIGRLHPNITLYNDFDDSRGSQIQKYLCADARRKPNFLLVMGTSLKVHGCRQLVKDVASWVHANEGIVVFVNRTELTKEWNSVFDYQVMADVDSWVEVVEKEAGYDKIQALIDFPAAKAGRNGKVRKKRRIKDIDEDAENKPVKNRRPLRVLKDSSSRLNINSS